MCRTGRLDGFAETEGTLGNLQPVPWLGSESRFWVILLSKTGSLCWLMTQMTITWGRDPSARTGEWPLFVWQPSMYCTDPFIEASWKTDPVLLSPPEAVRWILGAGHAFEAPGWVHSGKERNCHETNRITCHVRGFSSS